MKRILAYYDSDEEKQTKVQKIEQPKKEESVTKKIVKVETTIPEKKLKKVEIYEKLGLKNKVENDSDEDEEEDLSSTIQEEEKKVILEEKKLQYKPKQFFTPKLEKPEAVFDAPAMREGSDFMKKFESVIKGEKEELKVEYKMNPEETETKEEEFEMDPNIYGDEEFEEVEEVEEIGDEQDTESFDQVLTSEKIKQKPKNLHEMDLPEEIKREIHLKGGTVVDVSLDNPQDDQIRKRQQQKDRFKQTTQPKKEERIFTDLQKSKSQLSYLAHQSRISENDRLEKKANSSDKKKKTWSKYGW